MWDIEKKFFLNICRGRNVVSIFHMILWKKIERGVSVYIPWHFPFDSR